MFYGKSPVVKRPADQEAAAPRIAGRAAGTARAQADRAQNPSFSKLLKVQRGALLLITVGLPIRFFCPFVALFIDFRDFLLALFNIFCCFLIAFRDSRAFSWVLMRCAWAGIEPARLKTSRSRKAAIRFIMSPNGRSCRHLTLSGTQADAQECYFCNPISAR